MSVPTGSRDADRRSRPKLVGPRSQQFANMSRRWAARLTPGDRELPTYFIVGTKRGGTTSLNEYIVQHPHVMRALVTKGCRYFDVNFDKGWDWFCSFFPGRRAVDRREVALGVRPLLGESSPYYCFHPHAAERIASRFPDARLIFCIREPVARAWSHYQYEVARGNETLGFEAALDAEATRLETGTDAERAYAHRHHAYIGRGVYADQLEHLWRHFSRDQVLVVESERLFSDPMAVLAMVHEHLGLAEFAGDYGRAHKQNHYEGLDPTSRQRLIAAYEGPNEQLRPMVTGISWLDSGAG